MKIINAIEFSEMLQSAPGISETKFEVYAGNIITGDHAIPLFFHTAEGRTFVVENQFGKPPRSIEINSSALEDILLMKVNIAVFDEGYFYMAIMRYDSLEASQKAHELYETLPADEFAIASLNALQGAEWVTIPQLARGCYPVGRDALEVELSKPENINLSLVKFYYDNTLHLMIGKGLREEVMLELIRFDKDTHQAYFSGIVAGKPIYQRVKLEEVTFRGDYDFLKWVRTHNFDNGEAGHGLWWIRHMGVSLHAASNSLTLKNPHLSVRGLVKEIPDSYDTINNRTVIL